jgi:hypothetical protein
MESLQPCCGLCHWVGGSVDLFLEYTFYVGVVSLILGLLLLTTQIVAVRLFRASTERAWTLRIWPALLISIGIVGLSLPAAITRFAPIDLGKHESRVNGERHVTLTGWDQKDYSVLAQMSDVIVLQMANADVTDQTLSFLQKMTRLRELDLAGTQLTDAGLKSLSGLTSLEKLILSRTRVTDAGLAPLLEKLPALKQLDVRETGVTPAVLRSWLKAQAGRRALPRVPLEEEPQPVEGSK